MFFSGIPRKVKQAWTQRRAILEKPLKKGCVSNVITDAIFDATPLPHVLSFEIYSFLVCDKDECPMQPLHVISSFKSCTWLCDWAFNYTFPEGDKRNNDTEHHNRELIRYCSHCESLACGDKVDYDSSTFRCNGCGTGMCSFHTVKCRSVKCLYSVSSDQNFCLSCSIASWSSKCGSMTCINCEVDARLADP